MSESNDRAVGRFLSDRLECEIETRPAGEHAGTVFVPDRDGCGELHLEEQMVREAKPVDLVERLRKEEIDRLLRRGECVKLSAVATEILPRAARSGR